jgi:hypothetical protein
LESRGCGSTFTGRNEEKKVGLRERSKEIALDIQSGGMKYGGPSKVKGYKSCGI